MFSDSFPDYIQNKFPDWGRLRGMKPVSGGDINAAWQLQFDRRKLFVKHNSAEAYPQMFEREAEALAILQRETSFTIPQCLEYGELYDQAFLLLEWLPSAARNPDFWENFGQKLAPH